MSWMEMFVPYVKVLNQLQGCASCKKFGEEEADINC